MVGEEDPRYGQHIRAYVRLRDVYRPSRKLQDEILDFHNNRCSGHKKIYALSFVSALPRNQNGKVDRRRLTEDGRSSDFVLDIE